MDHFVEHVEYSWVQGDFLYRTIGIGSDDEGNETISPTNGSKVIRIDEHVPMGEGDRLWYDVHFEDGEMERIFNPSRVLYRPISEFQSSLNRKQEDVTQA